MKITLGTIGGLVLLLAIGVLIFTQTDLGRERLRRVALGRLTEAVHGNVRIGKMRGNLLSGAMLEDVEITDSTGAPFLKADSVYIDYSVRSLLSSKIFISELRMVRPVIVLDKRPGQEWNFARIFPSDTVPQDTLQQGFGSWVRIQDLSVRDGRLLVRNEWQPDSTLAGAARDSAIAAALSRDNRLWVVRAPGGYQSIHDFRQLNARLPLLRLADPDSSSIRADIASLSTVAYVFRPPAAVVRKLAGRFIVSEDSLWFQNLRVALPRSQLTAQGVYALDSGGVRAGLRAAPFQLGDFQWLRPALPDSGGGRLELAVTQGGERTRVLVRTIDVRIGDARLAGHADVQTGDSLRLGNTRLRFAGIDTRLVERLAPEVEIPVAGSASGQVTLAGTPGRLRVDGRVAFRERGGGLSRVVADGVIGTGGNGFRAQNLRLRFQPVQVALARAFRPDLPVGGTVTGQATLTGSANRGFALAADLVHRAPQTGRSRLLADGRVKMGDELAADNLRIRLQPMQVALARAFAPDLPLGGTVAGRITLDGAAKRLRLDADLVHQQAGIGRSRVLAAGGVRLGDGFVADNLRLRFQPVQVALARAFAPDLPVGGVIAGRVTLDGAPERMRLDADLTHQGGGMGRSHLLANGAVRLADGFAARELRLRFDPLQMELARAFAPDLPVGGTLSGRATVSGSPDTRVAADVDLVHRDRTGRSHVIGDVRVAFAEPQRFDVRLRAPVLSLATVGRFAPSAGLQGSASGELTARGTLRDLALAAELAVQGGGEIDVRGSFDLASERKRYDLQARLDRFDAGALSTRAPHTAFTGTVALEGRGTDPATAQATLSANLTDARIDRGGAEPIGVDEARVLARVANGLLTVERGTLRLASAQADLNGSFGLLQGREGTLRYRIAVDSLSDFASLLPVDTAAAQRKAPEQKRRTVIAVADSARTGEMVGVERTAARDSVAPPPLAGNPAPPPRDSLAGSLRAEGTLAGNLERFDLRGTAALDRVVAAGNAVGRGTIQYAWLGAGTPRFSLDVSAALDSVRAGALALDSARTRLDYTGGTEAGAGTARVTLFQDPQHDYRLTADYRLALGRKEVLFDDLALRFDTTTWTSARPGRVSWGGEGAVLDSVELRSNTGGRVFADGRVATEGPVGVRLEVDRLQVGDLLALVQDTAQARGLLSLRADVTGTARAPSLQGTATVTDASYAGTTLPALHSTFAYADTTLTARAALTQGGDSLLVAVARLPVNLALGAVQGPRLLDGPLAVDVRADSLPLDALPTFSDAVDDVQGRIRGQVAVRGTIQDPAINGLVNLDLGSLRIVQPGVDLRDLVGTLRIRGDSVFVDSLVARSGNGPIRVAGALDISTPTEPAFDLSLEARDARVLNNELGTLRADATLAVNGPFDAVRVTGTVNVDEGTLYIPESDPNLINLEDPALAPMLARLDPGAEIVAAPNPLLAGLRVDVGVRVARNTWARNREANVEIYTPEDERALRVQMDRRTQSLTLDGTINVDRGEYEFSGRRFELTSGSVVFLGGAEIDPLLQLSAVHEVPQQSREPLGIQINIGGYLSEPRITLSSNSQPPVSQSDLLSYLAFGRSSSALLQPGGSGLTGGQGGGGELGALATQQLAGVALGAVVNDLVSDLEQQAGRAGLDVIRISPADDLPEELVFDRSLSNVLRGTEIEAGKYLSRRLFIAGQGRPTGETWPGLVVEYRTPGGFLWRTTWEPRYLPREPSLATDQVVDPKRVFGSFLIWERRF